MKRAAIYTRYSSDLQNDRSIEDQVVLCRAFAIKSGLEVAGAYEDRAMSGSSVHGRHGLLKLMADARARKFDVVLVESLDRVSRDQEDLPAIWKRLNFLEIDIIAVHEGKADQMQVGMRAIVGAMYLTDLAHKTRRGLVGVIRDGRHAGGVAYGYVPVAGKPGELSIVDDQAAIVRRIFAEYVAGAQPRDIVARLNAEGVKPPRGAVWHQSTINGNMKRGYGIILNELYAGRIVWNRVRMIMDPDTGKRVSRVNPTGEWLHAEAPRLRIIDDETWMLAQAVKRERFVMKPHLQRKPRELLSGLLRCATCGGGMSIVNRAGGRARIVCTRHKEAAACRNGRIYYMDTIEQAVVRSLREQLREKAAIKYFVDVYNAERRELVMRARAERARLESRLAAIEREYTRTRDGFIKGFLTEADTQAALPSLRAERTRLEAELAASAEPPKVVALHPGAIKHYLGAVDELDAAIKAGTGEGSERSRAAFRALIESVTVHAADRRGGHDLTIAGRLAYITQCPDGFPQGRLRGGLVAGEGLEPPTYGL